MHESNYTKQTWSNLLEVLQKAKDVIEDGDVSQKEVNKSLKELNESLSALEYVNDKESGKGTGLFLLPKTGTYVYNALLLEVILLVTGDIILYIRSEKNQE